jgi:hypothetical protein
VWAKHGENPLPQPDICQRGLFELPSRRDSRLTFNLHLLRRHFACFHGPHQHLTLERWRAATLTANDGNVGPQQWTPAAQLEAVIVIAARTRASASQEDLSMVCSPDLVLLCHVSKTTVYDTLGASPIFAINRRTRLRPTV